MTKPAVVFGAEAYGPNPFIAGVAARLEERGYITSTPDYYHGTGPKDVEAYDDFDEVREHIGRLDFTAGARTLTSAIDEIRRRPDVDPSRVAVWGYCTGGTLAWLAACQRGDVACAVLFFPSQPVFHELGPKAPVSPIDLLWQLTCPTLFLYGDNDPVVPPDVLGQLRQRIGEWGVDAEIKIYPGAGHSFSAPWGPMRHDDADRRSWADATAFLDAYAPAGDPNPTPAAGEGQR